MADALDLLIAGGPGKYDTNAMVSGIGNGYFQGLEEAQKQKARDVFKGGVPTLPDGSPDYAAMSKSLYQLGDIGQGNTLSNLDIQRRALTLGPQAADAIAGTAPGATGGIPPSTSANGLATQPGTGSRTPANPRVVGDNQNSITGLVSSRISDPNQAGPIIAKIAQQTGRDPNEPLTDPAVRQMVVDAARPLLGGSQPPAAAVAPPQQPQAQPQPQQPMAAPGAAPQPTVNGAPASLPPGPASGIVPPGQDPAAFADRFEQQATALEAQAARVSVVNPKLAEQYQARAKELNDRATQIRQAVTKYNEAYTGEEATRAGKKYDAVVNAGNLASESLPQIRIATNLMNDPNFYSGAGETANLLYKRVLTALGGDANTAQPQEAFRKVVSNGLLDQIKGLSGSGAGQIRVAEIKIMQQAAASPDNTPWGNRTLLEMSSRVAQRNVEVARMAENYNNGRLDPGFDRAVREYDKTHPLFSEQELQNPSLLGAPTVSPEQAKKLPSNVPVIRTTDGRYVYRQHP